MKKPRQPSTEPDLPEGKAHFPANVAFASTRIIVTRPIPGSRDDHVLCTVDDVGSTFPYGLCTFYGGITGAGDIEIFLINYTAAATIVIPDVYINWIVLPK